MVGVTPALLNALASIGALVFMSATTAATLIQLRHMRAANALSALLAIERDFRAAAIQHALAYVAAQLPQRLDDPDYRALLAKPGYIAPARHPEMLLCNWFNRTGVLVRDGLLKEELFFDTFGRLVTYYWDLLMPVIAVLRRTRGPSQYAGFEFLAYRARRHMPANAEPAISDAPSA
jgi:hypothetical protein